MSKSEMNQEESTQLESLSTEQLDEIVKRGENIHISVSEAAHAKRILESRRAVESSASVAMIKKYLQFMQENWFIRRPLWQQVLIFISSSVVLAFLVNLASNLFTHLVLHW